MEESPSKGAGWTRAEFRKLVIKSSRGSARRQVSWPALHKGNGMRGPILSRLFDYF
jgi:hypothetical protein